MHLPRHRLLAGWWRFTLSQWAGWRLVLVFAALTVLAFTRASGPTVLAVLLWAAGFTALPDF